MTIQAKKKTTEYCLTCPLFDGYGNIGVSQRYVNCRWDKTKQLTLRMGECYPDECPLPVVIVRKGG